MSTGDPPGFLTVLPLVALLGLLGGSYALAAAVRALADSTVREDLPPASHLTAACAGLNVGVVVVAAVTFVLVGGFPAGPLFALGAPLLTLLVAYGIPLAIGSRVFGMTIEYWAGEHVGSPVQRRSFGLFAVGQSLTMALVWGLFVLVG